MSTPEQAQPKRRGFPRRLVLTGLGGVVAGAALRDGSVRFWNYIAGTPQEEPELWRPVSLDPAMVPHVSFAGLGKKANNDRSTWQRVAIGLEEGTAYDLMNKVNGGRNATPAVVFWSGSQAHLANLGGIHSWHIVDGFVSKDNDPYQVVGLELGPGDLQATLGVIQNGDPATFATSQSALARYPRVMDPHDMARSLPGVPVVTTAAGLR